MALSEWLRCELYFTGGAAKVIGHRKKGKGVIAISGPDVI